MSAPSTHQRTENKAITPSTYSLWFSDGNVVLQAGNVRFRVHWGVLAQNSSVFRDMQGLPRPTDQPSVKEFECPIIKLSDDPVDVKYLLNALYDPTFLAQKTLPFAAVSAFIRLGRKYGLKNILNLAVARVTAVCPATLQAHDALLNAGSWETIEWYNGIEFDMVTLLSENKISSALPCAYYRAVRRHSQKELFYGINKGDGTRVSLSQSDLRSCAIGQHTLFHKQFEPGYTLGWARKWEFTDCTSSAVCRSSRKKILKFCTEYYGIWALVGPKWFELKPSDVEFCVACGDHAEKSLAAGKKKIWKELPEIFDLPPWSELKNGL
ncbi:hypothetical protein MSAN_00675100 [Mycena sanguinolenta]|uniref:BTB domain-containing protein n=1 Tax=Mycena sanguinolenta TaxID=230812 RepID=A0A8H7DCI0_9AGAR|nr:hypothetical protein MSAN_00675100 [Mycena sanguinolenta]